MSMIRSNSRAVVSAALARLMRTRRDRWVFAIAAAVLAGALAVGGVLVYHVINHPKQITAYFAESVGVYPGSTVRVLGVPVGTVDSVQPAGSRVKVTMTLNSGVAVPATVSAVVISPSVVSDRYIQLTPAYTRGPQIADGAAIPLARTAVPVEVDQVYASLAKLANALGPNGVNKNGALSDLIKTGAANLAGNGAYLRQMITEFGGLSRTLGNSSGNLFATVAYLQRFTTMLKDNNGQVRERASLAEALDVAPLAADNLVHAYDATTHTLVGRGYLGELIRGNTPRGAFTTADTRPSGAIAPVGSVPVPASLIGSLPPLPLPSAGTVYGTPQALLGGRR